MNDTQILPLTIIQASRALRLAGVAKHVGPHVFDDAESFDAVFGRGSFAEYDRCTLDTARAVVECSLDQTRRFGRTSSELAAEIYGERLKREHVGG